MAKEIRPAKKTASSMAEQIREISISEFFSKNRHLLGFDNPLKSLLTVVREGVDNSLDACEEGHILPEIIVQIVDLGNSHFQVSIEDNGPGIVKTHLPNIFGKLLYGSKFHRLKQSRGQQGIGISAAVMYGQMTTGKPAEVISKTHHTNHPHRIKLQIDTKKNAPKVVGDQELKGGEWAHKESGTRISITLEGAYKEGRHGVLSYLSQTALSNPHAEITYIDPKKETHRFPRLMNELPKSPLEIKPHPHGLELGTWIQLLHDAKRKSLEQFLKTEFSRVTEPVVKEIGKLAKVKPTAIASSLDRGDAEALFKAIQAVKLQAPPTNCLSPMQEEAILKALYWLFVAEQSWEAEEEEAEELKLSAETQAAVPVLVAKKGKGKKTAQPDLFDEVVKKEEGEDPLKAVRELKADQEASVGSHESGYFVTAVTRPPNVYRGNPFQVEVGIFYGGDLKADALAQVFRYANRVPLQYQASACAMSKAVNTVPWKSYGLQQTKGAPPTGPVVIMMHMASVWVPYTSESKEAVAHYPEILKELRLALMECGRRLQRFLRRKRREADEAKKRSYIEKYLEPIGEALQEILKLPVQKKIETVKNLEIILERTRGQKQEAAE